MKIYTKTGDNGTTALFGGKRLLKSDPQISAYGTIDELTSFIGFLIAKITLISDKAFLTDIQKGLYIIMTSLSGSPIQENLLRKSVLKLENKIDEVEVKLPKLTHFILPQGNEITALYHIARTVTRRAERETVKHYEKAKDSKSKIYALQYLKRLSDFFFVMARLYNKKEVLARI